MLYMHCQFSKTSCKGVFQAKTLRIQAKTKYDRLSVSMYTVSPRKHDWETHDPLTHGFADRTAFLGLKWEFT